MNKNTIVVAVIALLVIGLGIGYGLRGKNIAEAPTQNMGMHEMSDGTMMDGADHMMHMSVSSERGFIEGMIPHHQEAVDTAKEVIARGGTTPEVKVLVENIVKAQEAEIADMKAWYKSWYGEEYVNTNQYQPMMRDLTNLSGVELDKAFLEDMIMHHMGAIMMARSVEPYIAHAEITTLTEAIVRTQSEEISEMRSMLQSL